MSNENDVPRQIKLSVVLPAKNEAAAIGQTVSTIVGRYPGAEVLVVNDGSSDATAAIAEQAGARVIDHPYSKGNGAAIKTGARAAQGDVIVFMDADGQHDPAGIPVLADTVVQGGADVAIGSRFRGQLKYRVPWVKRAGMALFGWTVSRITGRQVTDPTSGFQALNADALRFFAADNYPVDYPDADTLLILHYAGFRVVEAPMTVRERLVGDSKLHSGWKPFYYVAKMWLAIGMVVLRQKTNIHPRRTT